MSKWRFREVNHDGISYSDETIASEYDENHRQFRDYDREAQEAFELIGLSADSTVIDLGAGTGAFSIALAKQVQSVHAVDISGQMLVQLNKKADQAGINSITTEQAGFLSFAIPSIPFDGAISSMALHHLPDFWKQIALKRIAESLKIGGRFLLIDVIYDFPFEEYAEQFDAFTGYFKEVNPQMYEECIVHIRDEMSTFSWIIETMLEKAGFQVDQKISDGSCIVKYACTRVK